MCYAHELHIYLPDWYGDSRTVEISTITHNLTPVWRPHAFRPDAVNTARAASPIARSYFTACNDRRQIHAQRSEMRSPMCATPVGSTKCPRTSTHTTHAGTFERRVTGSPTSLQLFGGPPALKRRVETMSGMTGKGSSTSDFDCGQNPIEGQGICEVRDGCRARARLLSRLSSTAAPPPSAPPSRRRSKARFQCSFSALDHSSPWWSSAPQCPRPAARARKEVIEGEKVAGGEAGIEGNDGRMWGRSAPPAYPKGQGAIAPLRKAPTMARGLSLGEGWHDKFGADTRPERVLQAGRKPVNTALNVAE